MAHGRRLQAAAVVICFFQCFPMILPVCFSQVFNSSFLFLCFSLSLSLFLLYSASLPSPRFFFSPVFLFLLLLSRFPPFSLFFLFSSVFSFLFLPSLSAFLGSIYRAKGVAFYCSHGEQPAGRPLGAIAKVRLPRFSGKCAAGGRPVCLVGGLQAREGPTKIQTKAPFFLLPRCMFGGRRKGNSAK